MNIEQLQARPFDPKTASEDVWTAFHTFTDALYIEKNPGDPQLPHAIRQQHVISMEDNPMFAPAQHIIWQDSTTIAGFYGVAQPRADSPDYDVQKVMVFAWIDVAAECRRQGLGSRMLSDIVTECHKIGDHVEWIQIGSQTEAGFAFIEHYGGAVAWVGKENRLSAADVDWNMVQQWYDEGPGRAPGVTIEIFEGMIADTDLEAYCTLYTEIDNQQPLGDLEGAQMTITPEVMRHDHEDAAKRGDTWITAITREADGTISGLTDILYNPQRPHRVAIRLTGVKDNYRGRGLGKWVKAAMMLHIKENYPDFKYVTTDNADSNAPMLSINNRLGFKPYKEDRTYKMRVEEVAAKLAQVKQRS